VFLLPFRLAHALREGPGSRAFIDFSSHNFREKESSVLTPQEASSRIIVALM